MSDDPKRPVGSLRGALRGGIPRLALVGACMTGSLVACSLLPENLATTPHSDGASSGESQNTQSTIDPSVWASELEWLRQAAQESRNTQVILEMIADGYISDEEVLQALALEQQCIQDNGIPEMTYSPDGAMNLPDDVKKDLERWMPVFTECTEQTAGTYVRAVWEDMRSNPHHVDEHEYLAACLVKLKVVSPSFSGEDINKLLSGDKPPSPEGEVLDRDPLEAIPYIVDTQQGKAALERCVSEPQKVMYESDGE